MIQPTERFPIDFDTLKKGDVISRERCEEIIKLPQTDERYGLKLMSLKETIMKGMENRGCPVTIKIDHGSLQILTDEDAAEYNPLQFDHGLRKAAHAHRRTMLVDPANLTDEQRKKIDRRIEIQGKMLQAVSDSRKTLSAEPHRRIQ